MKPKEIIKNALRNKLKELSKEELVDIISELSSLYVMSHALRRDVYPMGVAECGCELRTDLQDIIDATKQSMPVYNPSINEVVGIEVNYKEDSK
jgi:hypothetical protein